MSASLVRIRTVQEPEPRPFRLVAIGGSAGGITALIEVLKHLPESFPIPIVVIQHLALSSQLPRVLGFRTALRCKWAESGENPRAGCIHVAPPGGNLALSEAGTFLRSSGPRPRMGWPSVDVFLNSAAGQLGRELIAVVLSGMLRDGADGISAVRRAGGATMAQHPSSAEHPDMPSAAVDLGRADLLMSPARIAEALEILAERGIE